MEHLLPIFAPPITSYQMIALPLTVAMANVNFENWFYSNYIQVRCINRKHYNACGHKDNALHYSLYSPEVWAVDLLEHIDIEGKAQLFLFKSMALIRDIIDSGWYIYTNADTFYINGSDTYMKYHYDHDLLIYGYDDDHLYLYRYGDSKLTSHKIFFEDFITSYFSKYCQNTEYRSKAILFKPNDEKYEVNVEKIKWQIHDYLDGVETFAREYPNVFNPGSLSALGVNTYREFDNLLIYILANDDKFLRRTDLFAFYEHKKLMYDRVLFLKDKKILAADDQIIEGLQQIYKKANNIMMLGLKMNRMQGQVERQNDILYKLMTDIQNIRTQEIKIWEKYIALNKELLG